MISYRQAQLAKLKNVEVHLGIARMSADDVLNYGADKVVMATGAHWATDGLGAEGHRPIKGVDASRPEVLTPEQVMAGKAIPGSDAVVLDGDGYLTGVSMAEILAERGKRVTLVTNMNNVAEFSRFTMELPNNKRMLYERNVQVMTNHWAQSFVPGHLSLFLPLSR